MTEALRSLTPSARSRTAARFGVALTVAAALGAAPAGAADWPSSGHFDVAEFEDSCVVGGEFAFDGRSDVRFRLVFDGDQVFVALASLDWSPADDGEEATLVFRGADHSYTGPMQAYTEGIIYNGFSMVAGPEILNDFAAGSSLMVLKGDAVVTHINLRGSAGATATLRRCVNSVLSRNAAQARREQQWDYIERNPFADGPGSANDAASPSQPQVITNPSWSVRPMPEFPARALDRGVESGSVTIECGVAAGGALSSCSIVSEAPAGEGFGQAALRAARSARLSPRSVNNVAAGGRVRFPLTFRSDGVEIVTPHGDQ